MIMEKRNFQKFEFTSFWKEEDDDIILWNYEPRLEMDLTIAKKLVKYRLEYTQNKNVYTLIDFTHVKSVTKEARDYMSDPEGGLRGVLGGAFLSNNVVAILFINLYLKVSNPIVPAKFFTRKEEALNWLKKIKAERKELV
jgi:hypothetical protein